MYFYLLFMKLLPDIVLGVLDFASSPSQLENELTKYCHREDWLQAQQHESIRDWRVAGRITCLRPRMSHDESDSLFSLVDQQLDQIPKRFGTLLLPTTWYKDGRPIVIRALLDTGCGTSAVTTSLLEYVTNAEGQPFKWTRLSQPITLTSATGGQLVSHKITQLSFVLGNGIIEHKFFVFDELPEKIVLGMYFLIGKKVSINGETGALTIPDPQVFVDIRCTWDMKQRLPLFSLTTLTLPPGYTTQLELSTLHRDTSSISTFGCVQVDHQAELPKGIVVWSGITEKRPDCSPRTWISNFSAQSAQIPQETFIGWWSPHSHEEVKLADSLIEQARMIKASAQPHTQCLTLTNVERTSWTGSDTTTISRLTFHGSTSRLSNKGSSFT